MQDKPKATIKDEVTLYEVEGFKVTSHRVRAFEDKYLRSIMLESVCCCTGDRRERRVLLVLGILCLLGAVVLFATASGPGKDIYLLSHVFGLSGEDIYLLSILLNLSTFLSLIAGVLLLAAWYRSRRQPLIVASANGTIERDFAFKADLREVIEIIEAAKARRAVVLSGIASRSEAAGGGERQCS